MCCRLWLCLNPVCREMKKMGDDSKSSSQMKTEDFLSLASLSAV